MNRRQFIRNTLLVSATATVWPRLTFGADQKDSAAYQKLDHLSLSDFEAEQDEAPILFGNGSQTWLTTLRRKDFPDGQEIISCFALDGKNWKEIQPVTVAGEYEAVAADCAHGGEPIVVWTAIENSRFLIKATASKKNKFQAAITISDPAQRSINPVVKAIGPHSYLVAWEVFAQGQFTIHAARCDDGKWTTPVKVAGDTTSCFEPALAVAKSGEIYLAYTSTEGVHRNIFLAILDPQSLATVKTVSIAIGGGLKDRVNINAHPSLAFDHEQRLWISWENNRFTARLEDSDNYTGDRCCAMVCYADGQLSEQKEIGRWLFTGENDHLPTFFKNPQGQLYVLTHSGGTQHGKKEYYSFRISRLDPALGWTPPVTLAETKQKGELQRPSIAFAEDGRSFWFVWKSDLRKQICTCCPGPEPEKTVMEMVEARRGRLEMERYVAPEFSRETRALNLVPTIVNEFHPVENFRPLISGRSRQPRPTLTYNGDTYTLLRGNLHEHTEKSICWPAGTDGTLHEDFRYALYSEGYDFAGITDHTYSLNEVYWRKSLRMAEFYHDPEFFVALPAAEWTLSNNGKEVIGHGVGHRNLFFADVSEARKFIRNKEQVYSEKDPETQIAPRLWEFIRKHKIDCVSIPHHPADEVHACDWDVRDEDIEPVVEIFQCRGNAEYRGAPRMINVSRHHPMANNDKGFVDYALREKKYRLGFVASGDHNGMGVGLACVWVKEVSRRGILEALRARRCFATTGDQIVVDFRVNGVWCGETAKTDAELKMNFKVEAMDEIVRVEILRNSRVVHTYEPATASQQATGEWTDSNPNHDEGVLYYYARVTQKNNHLAWSSPVWVQA
jgi:hypothetical protein